MLHGGFQISGRQFQCPYAPNLTFGKKYIDAAGSWKMSIKHAYSSLAINCQPQHAQRWFNWTNQNEYATAEVAVRRRKFDIRDTWSCSCKSNTGVVIARVVIQLSAGFSRRQGSATALSHLSPSYIVISLSSVILSFLIITVSFLKQCAIRTLPNVFFWNQCSRLMKWNEMVTCTRVAASLPP